jgi:RPA family protein
MSESGQSGAGRREVAYRLFATEFEDADLSYSESDEERAPNYVITPTGARINRMFVVGVLTEVEQVSDDVLRGRVVDPTGAFVIYAGQYQPDEMAFLETADPPMFVAVTGKARTFQPDDSDRVFTSIRPESINEVDADTRDRWTVQAAAQTLDRIAHMAQALRREERGDDLRGLLDGQDIDEGLAAGIPIAIDHYGTGAAYLDALRQTALDAAGVVAGTHEEVETPDTAPDERGDARLEPLTSAGTDVAPMSGGESESGAESRSSPEPSATDSPDATAADAETTTDSADATAADAGGTATADSGDSTADDEQSTAGETTDTPKPDTGAEEPAMSAQTAGSGGDDSVAVTESEESETEPTGEADDLGDFDPGEYELEDETREQIEEEYGTEFQSGTEVEEPGSADIETNDPVEDPTPSEDDTSTTEQVSTDPASDEGEERPAPTDEPDPVSESEESSEGEAADEPDDLQAAVVGLMDELDDGDGADRDAVLAEMQSRYGTGPEAAEEAIQDALMDGECYEPDEQTLKPI